MMINASAALIGQFEFKCNFESSTRLPVHSCVIIIGSNITT